MPVFGTFLADYYEQGVYDCLLATDIEMLTISYVDGLTITYSLHALRN